MSRSRTRRGKSKRKYSQEEVRTLLLTYGAQHVANCPQGQQNYWRLRPEYRPTSYVDKSCICGLDALLGHPDNRAQQG